MIDRKPIPIVFIHQGNSPYLPYAFWQARLSNPHSEIYLIGDGYSRHFGWLVNHVNREAYSKRASGFARQFVNFSTNPHEFELVCLQRWMILHEFLVANNIDRCLYLDSDILLYGNASADSGRFAAFGMTISGISGHSNYVQDLDMLDRFCRWIERAYESPEALRVLEEKYRTFRETHEAGGISDMTFFVEFKEEGEEDVLDLSEPIRRQVYDIAFLHLENYDHSRGKKLVGWEKDRRPYCFLADRTKVYMQTLHFQGEAKKYMAENISHPSRLLTWLVRINTAICLVQRAWKKIIRRGK